jgi:hypothetical protein
MSPLSGKLIAATTTKAGLTVTCELDQSICPSAIKVSEQEMEEINFGGIPSTGSGITPSPRGVRSRWVSRRPY